MLLLRLIDSLPLCEHVKCSAICADGSAGFYFMAANASSNDYIFRFMGGAGCAYNETYCEEIHDLR